jgi:hypothetical protein
MKCSHCGQDLGNGDAYEAMRSHIDTCDSEAARAFRKARDEEG